MWTHVGVRVVVVGWCFQLGMLWWSRQKGGAGTGKRADSSKSRSLTLFSSTFVFAPRRDWLPELPPHHHPHPADAPSGASALSGLCDDHRSAASATRPPEENSDFSDGTFLSEISRSERWRKWDGGDGGDGGMGGHKALIEAAMHHLCFIQTADAGASHQAAKQGTAQREIFKIQFKRPQSRLL